MIKKLILMLFVLFLLVVGCQNPSKTESEAMFSSTTDSITYQLSEIPQPPERPDKSKPTPTESVVPEMLPIPDSIGKIFCEGGNFLDVESGEYYTVTDYPYLDISAFDNEKHDHVVWEEYTVNDLDHDGTNEVICNIKDEGIHSFFLILAVVDDEVCAYRITFRGLNPLLKDGRISGSSGADDSDFYCIVSFSRDGYSEKTLAKEDDGYYEIDGEPVSEEDWILYCKDFITSEKAVWQPFSNLSNQ